MSVTSSTVFPPITMGSQLITESRYFPETSRPQGSVSYEVQSGRIGEGVFGKIYKVEANGETFAWKVAHDIKTLGRDEFEDACNDIKWEAELLQDLKGRENVIQIVALFKSVHGPTLLLEYHEKRDLGTYIKKKGGLGLSVKQASSVMRGLERALEACEAYEIIHRDLKPPNVLMRTVSDFEIDPVLADFGLSVKKDGEQVLVGGTIEYISPEISETQKLRTIYDYPYDMWSLGASLVELLRGSQRPLFPGYDGERLWALHKEYLIDNEGKAFKDLMRQIGERKCSTEEEWAEFRALEERITKMLRIDPERRLKPGEEINLTDRLQEVSMAKQPQMDPEYKSEV